MNNNNIIIIKKDQLQLDQMYHTDFGHEKSVNI